MLHFAWNKSRGTFARWPACTTMIDDRYSRRFSFSWFSRGERASLPLLHLVALTMRARWFRERGGGKYCTVQFMGLLFCSWIAPCGNPCCRVAYWWLFDSLAGHVLCCPTRSLPRCYAAASALVIHSLALCVCGSFFSPFFFASSATFLFFISFSLCSRSIA